MSHLLRRITYDDLCRCATNLPAEIQEDVGRRSLTIANTVIGHFLGKDWHTQHINHQTSKSEFMRLDFSSDRRREATVFRVINLAECLFNLQHIEGFDACIEQMARGAEKIESTYAELEFGELLFVHDIQFCFVIPKGEKGSDYDFEIGFTDGFKVPADAKCKFETTTIKPSSITNSLKKGKAQLPKDRPGIIFVKVPQSWIEDLPTALSLEGVARDFFSTTKRIISIKFYVSHLVLESEMVMHLHRFREITNELCRFHDGRDWEIFRENERPQSSWNGMPPKWRRIFNFPASS